MRSGMTCRRFAAALCTNRQVTEFLGSQPALLSFGAERHQLGFIRGQSGTLDQIDAVGNGWKHGVQALGDRLRLARQIDNQ